MNQKVQRLISGLLLGCAASACFAAVQLADTPIPVELNSSQVQPNIMFTLDDSGSMKFETLPELSNVYLVFPPPDGNLYGIPYYTEDQVRVTARFNGTGTDDNRYARYFRSSTFNALYYDPAKRYRPWTNADGSLMTNAVPTAALHNPANASEGSRNLTVNETSRSWVWKNDGVGRTTESITFFPATYFKYNGTHAATLRSNPASSDNVASDFEKVEIVSGRTYAKAPGRTICEGTSCYYDPGRDDCAGATCTYNEEIQNFANWYTYYRSRILASRAAIGKAFSQLNTSVRVGFGAINKGTATIDGLESPGTIVTGVKQFTGANRTTWFNELYGHTIPNDPTPLRRALDDVGQYFMRTDDSGPWGPGPQYSCRQSYNILMTDGYWSSDTKDVPTGFRARTAAAQGNVDGTDGLTITGPGGASYRYLVTPPDIDNNAATDENPLNDAAANTLADVAMYYWKNDLRSDLTNDVPKNSKDPAFWQHLVNFTVGLGVSGAPHAPGVWPDSVNTDPEKIVDLEHAADNSRGVFFNAADPEAFARNLRDALNDIAGRNNTFASNAVSNPNVSAIDNVTFGTSYNPAEWSGEISAYSLDPSTGEIGTTSLWNPSPKTLLDGRTTQTSDNRKIATYSGTAGIPFQWTSLTSPQKTSLTSQGVLEYLRGWRAGEGTTYRRRDHILGDIVNAEGVVVSTTDYHYNDTGYAGFTTDMSIRPKTLYQAANDGMLHAFNATTGQADSGKELWAYVPNLLMPKLKDLSANIGFTHKYYIDGSPVLADVNFRNTVGGSGPVNWRTILVGGLGKGGRGYYALDVTSAAAATEEDVAAKVLWEYVDGDMGFSYGKPVVVKTRAHGWVVLLTSGYNNVPEANGGAIGSTTGDGKGYLYVLNVRTGQPIKKIPVPMNTGTVDADYLSNPSGFTHIAGFVEDTDIDNTVDLVYGGDLNGDVWRFDLSADDETRWSVSKFATLKDGASPSKVLKRPGNCGGSFI